MGKQAHAPVKYLHSNKASFYVSYVLWRSYDCHNVEVNLATPSFVLWRLYDCHNVEVNLATPSFVLWRLYDCHNVEVNLESGHTQFCFVEIIRLSQC